MLLFSFFFRYIAAVVVHLYNATEGGKKKEEMNKYKWMNNIVE
jgi:hypothetical protein